KNFRVAVQHTNIIEYIVIHLTRENLELKTYGALTIFKCAEEKETRDIVYEHDGILPIMDLLSLKERNALAAATGAVWKCAQSEENAKRIFKQMDGIRLLWTLLKSYDDEVIINSAWALCLLIDDDQTDAENIRSFVGGLEILVNLLKSENLEVLTSVCAVISVVAVDYQNVGIISDYDVVPLLAELTNVKDNRLRRYLAEAIARCGVFGDNAKAFRTSGAVSKIVKYLYIEDTPLQEATVRALYQLSRDPANCAIIHKHGGVKLLLEMVAQTILTYRKPRQAAWQI
ncbi:Armadillo repeat-containing 4, partial [Paramuricea clavata]